jgi:HNH endonuclease/NUMOD4 motif-containing protein
MSAAVMEQQEAPAEQWREVPGYPSYEVSDHGRVRRRCAKSSWSAGHILRPASMPSGHKFVVLTDAAELARKQFVHRLVAQAFIGPAPFDRAMVLHHDDVPTNNTPGNLYWGTHAENVADARLNRRPNRKRNRGAQPGEENSSALLTEDQVRRIKGMLGLGLCGACIARLHGVRKETIYAIAKCRTWTHVTEEATPWIG